MIEGVAEPQGRVIGTDAMVASDCTSALPLGYVDVGDVHT